MNNFVTNKKEPYQKLYPFVLRIITRFLENADLYANWYFLNQLSGNFRC